ncbi:pentatricopeptide repeat-containing protein At3g26782, mitochondrial-like [Phoenix dactylifera]|uniref:Pentatricopeptide repeat-containing protein At3g26782, mitochondrial-like n=1 Tax=Phoenix dactylifera TaxID=42345 RepID=A0A8B9A801_PHODC|nr:pentatricopeptide repeat-containing protein At3g26782, mitochondrial-like [Phoenix dactylifera]
MNASPLLKSLDFQPRILPPSFLFSRYLRLFGAHSVERAITEPLNSLQCGHLLQIVTNSKSLEKGRKLHAHMVSSGVLLDNTYLSTKLCAMYAICGGMADARVVFDGISLKNPFLWNVMVRGYACNGFPLKALVLYREMLRSGKKADNFTYPFVLMACGDLLLIEVGKRTHSRIIVCGYESDVYVSNSLISMYSKFGEMELAQALFDKMLAKDLTSWNTIISGYAKNNDSGRALAVFAVLAMRGGGMDRATLLSILPACANLAALKQGKEIHAYTLRNSLEFDEFVVNAFIDVYVNSDFIAGARCLFEKISRKDTVSWNSLISGCARHGDAVESLKFFRRMNSEGMVPDEFTLVSALGACDRIAALQFGRSFHAYLTRKGFDNRVILGTALIDMYAKCGSLDCSRQAFDEMPMKNLVSWTAMISGYGLHGRGREAVACFNEMKTKNIGADKITFTSVLSACSHAGLVDEAKEIFHQMSKDYSISPSFEHYSCMVDVLGRAGHLDEVYKLILDMNVEPNVDVWIAFLSACRIHHNVELAEIASHNAFHLNPKGIGPYVSLSNVYAVEKRWSDVERVRTTARMNGLKKPPGCSFIELDMEIHRFLVGDKSHPQSKTIYAKLDELRQQLKKAGYIPDTSSVFYDVEEDVKENMLWDHSERLAIAFALLNTSPGMTIRITKNLRVCGDCHTATKLISKLVSREIVVRDAHRFHHFRNGSCSCGDYW